MVFTLLKKVVAFHVQIAIVQVGVHCLQGPVQGLFSGICWRGRWSRNRSGIPAGFQIRLHILPKQVLVGCCGRSSCGRSSCGRSSCGRSSCRRSSCGKSRCGRSRCSGARWSGAKCSGGMCSGGGAWSGRAKVCLRGGEATRLGRSSRATWDGSSGYS